MKALQGNKSLQAALRQILHPRTLAAGALLAPGTALADPTGGTVVEGDVSISQQGNGTIIDQGTMRAIVNWEQFNVGADEYVLFNQPGSSAVILNRIIGGDPSSILGTLSANGQVFLVNPAGIFFGQSAQLDVHGLLATTLDISNADFMSGNYRFSGSGDGRVVNEGSITADGGYVVLAGSRVDNSGVIAARAGKVVMAAGSAITLDVEGDGLVNFAVDEATLSDLAGVHNAGSILADGALVLMTAKTASDLVTTAVNNEGLVQARGISEQDGVIMLTAEGGDIANAGTLDANGRNSNDGGLVYLHGNGDIDLKDGSVITAAGDGQASGGVIRTIADNTLWFREGATLDVTGGNGNGGFLEVSGHGGIHLRGTANIGSGGTLLIDPTTMTIVTGSAGLSNSIGSVGTGFITGQLNAGANVAVVASSTITASSSVSAINATGNGNLLLGIGTLTTGASANCALNLGICVGTDPFSLFTAGSFGNIDLGSVDINIGGDFSAIAQQGTVNLGNVSTAGGAISITGDHGISVGSLDAAGNITLDAGGAAFGIFDTGVSVSGDINAGGDVNITAIGSASYGGGNVGISGNIDAEGIVDIRGSGASNGSVTIIGSINGSEIYLTNRNGNTGIINVTGNLNATNSTGKALIYVETGTSGSIDIDGDLIANGHAEGGFCEGSDCIEPLAAGITLNAGNNGSITLGGDVLVTAHGENITFSNTYSNTYSTLTGFAGSANLSVTGSSVVFGGGINMTGPDVYANFQVNSLDIDGPITLTGTGHDITSQTVYSGQGSSGSITSSNNAGNAEFRVNGISGLAASNVRLRGALSVTGIGSATVEIAGDTIATRGITVEAATATFQRNISGSIPPFLRGGSGSGSEQDFEIDEGTTVGGKATLALNGGTICDGSCNTLPATSVNVNGAINVAGQGVAEVLVNAGTIGITGAINVDAGAGSVNGTRTDTFFDSATSTSYDVLTTLQGDIGNAVLNLQSAGNVTVGGDIVLTGLTGQLDIEAGSGNVNVQGVSITGTGGTLHRTREFTPVESGSSYTSSFEGPAERMLASITGNNVTVDGDISLSGVGVVGLQVAGFGSGPVINGDVSVSATNASVTEFDSRDMASPVTTTYGDAAVLIGQFSGSSAIGAADINGSVNLDAGRDAHLLLNADIRDALIVNAGRHIDTVLPAIYGDEQDPDGLPAVDLDVTAGGLGLSAGGRIDFAGGTLNVDTNDDIAVLAGGNIILGNGTLTGNGLIIDGEADVDLSSITLNIAGNGDIDLSAVDTLLLGTVNFDTSGLLTMSAGASINGGTGSYSVAGLGVTAGQNIDFSQVDLTVNGTSDIALVAGNIIQFGTVNLTTTGLLSMTAGGDISATSGSITADGLALITSGAINMSGTTFNVGDATFADLAGDPLLLLGLGVDDLAPPSDAPNATFVAGEGVDIGSLSVAGGYAWFEAPQVFFNGSITGPDNLLVQFTPFAGEGDVTITGAGPLVGGAKASTPGLILDLGTLTAIQDGATIAIGTSDYTGNVSIDTINIGARNFIVGTSGSINTLDNVTTTGKVKSLSELLAVALFDEPLIDEIDTDFGGTNRFNLDDEEEVGDEEGEDTDGDGIPDTDKDDPLIKHDSTDEDVGVCKA